MPQHRGGQNSETARKGTAEPDAERSGSEDDPMGDGPDGRCEGGQASCIFTQDLLGDAPGGTDPWNYKFWGPPQT